MLREPVLVDGGTALFHGDCLEVLREFPDACLDVVVTDPPYGLSNTDPKHVTEALTKWIGGDREFLPKVSGGFMGKAWDSFVPPVAVWDECLRVLKPGGYVLTFAGTRTVDLMGVALRLAGFDIRDSVAWLYGSGFPKSMNVSKAIASGGGRPEDIRRLQMGEDYTPSNRGRVNYDHGGGSAMNGAVGDVVLPPEAEQWQGWGTALKPAHEPILVARKPLGEKTVAANVLKHGTGALNIDATRVATDDDTGRAQGTDIRGGNYVLGTTKSEFVSQAHAAGRWPANVVLDESQAEALDEQSGIQRDGVAVNRNKDASAEKPNSVYGKYKNGSQPDQTYGGGGGASRFFTVIRKEDSCYDGYSDSLLSTDTLGSTETLLSQDGEQSGAPVENLTSARFLYSAKAKKSERPDVDGVKHPTVKPLSVMQWLIRLATPPGGVVLDPFAGSGTTLEAARKEGFRAFGIERDESYIPLITSRIERTPQTWVEVVEEGSVDEPYEEGIEETE